MVSGAELDKIIVDAKIHEMLAAEGK